LAELFPFLSILPVSIPIASLCACYSVLYIFSLCVLPFIPLCHFHYWCVQSNPIVVHM